MVSTKLGNQQEFRLALRSSAMLPLAWPLQPSINASLDRYTMLVLPRGGHLEATRERCVVWALVSNDTSFEPHMAGQALETSRTGCLGFGIRSLGH